MVDDGAVRVSDAERERVARRLTEAMGEGRLAPGEFDERVRAAYGAVVRADLPPLVADLPESRDATEVAGPAVRVDVTGRQEGRRRREEGRLPARPRGPLAAAAAVWAVVSALNLGIWAIVALAAPGPVHPWWIWVAGPWGAVLALHALAARAGVARPGTAWPGVPRGLPLPGSVAALASPCGARRRR